MEEDKVILQERVLTQVLRLNANVCGMVTGMLGGMGLFLATNWLVVKGGVQVGKHLSLLNQYFPGYRVTFLGSFMGLVYGFAVGYLIGYCVAWIYNLVLRLRPGWNGVPRTG